MEAEYNRASGAMSSASEAASEASEAASEASDTSRLEAFSDGVFAVAITLLVLDLRVPLQAEIGGNHGDLLDFLGTQWPNYLAYVTSFLTILVMWINHHALFKLIGRSDRVLLIYNGLLLMIVTAVPFTTSLVAEYVTSNNLSDKRTVGVIYSGFFILISVAFNLLWRYAAKERRLLADSTQQAHIDGVNRSFRLGPLAYVVALALAFVDIRVCLMLNFMLAIYYALPHTERAPKASDMRVG